MKTLVTAAWVVFGFEVLFVAGLFLSRNIGDDAAGRGLATAWGLILAPILLVAGGLLWWGSRGGPKVALVVGLLAVGSPVLAFGYNTARGFVRKTLRGMARSRHGRYQDPRLRDLARAIDRADLSRIREVLAAGPVDWEARDPFGRTILGYAVTGALEYGAGAGRVDAVEALLRAGAKPADNAVSPERTSAEPDANHLLAVAIGTSGANQLRVLDLLLGAGLPTDGVDMDDHSVMFSTYMNREKFEVLARHGADFRVLDTRSDRLGWSTAMVWAELEDWGLVQFLLDHGVPADHRAGDGTTLAAILAEKVADASAAGGKPDPALVALEARVGGGRRR